MNPHRYFLQAIPSGPAGIDATLNIMTKLVSRYKVNPAIRKLALSIVRKIPGKSWAGEARAVQQWVKANIRYTRDVYGVETIQTPVETLKQGQGDCDDHSTLVASLLSSIGHPTRFVAVAFSPNSYSHVLSETKIGDKWVSIETTQDWSLGRFPKNVLQRKTRHNRK